MRKLLKFEFLGVTLIIFVFIWLCSLLPVKREILNPIFEALSDFDTSDIVFSRLRDEQPADTNIVIINIGNLSRLEIAREINIVNSYNPKVIGLDVFFEGHKNIHSDSILTKAILDCKDIVLVSKLGEFDKGSGSYDRVYNSINANQDIAYSGYANLPGNEDNVITIRYFKSRVKFKNSNYDAFAVRVAGLYNQDDLVTLFNKGDKPLIINYRGEKNKFYYLKTGEVENSNIHLDFIKNKIVLFGFVTAEPKVIEDIFFTPLNNRYAGRTIPDMNGVIIHANIISMIINKEYMDAIPGWLNLLLAILICYFNVFIIKMVKDKYADWFDVLTLIIIMVESVILLFLSLETFLHVHLKISLTLTLISLIFISDALDVYDNLRSNFVKLFHNLMKRVSL